MPLFPPSETFHSKDRTKLVNCSLEIISLLPSPPGVKARLPSSMAHCGKILSCLYPLNASVEVPSKSTFHRASFTSGVSCSILFSSFISVSFSLLQFISTNANDNRSILVLIFIFFNLILIFFLNGPYLLPFRQSHQNAFQ